MHSIPSRGPAAWAAVVVAALLFVLGGSLLVARGGDAGPASARSQDMAQEPVTRTLALPLIFARFVPEHPNAAVLHLPLIFDNRQLAIPSIFGVQLYNAPDTPAAALALTAPAGVRWIRMELAWGKVEPANTTPEHYDFSAYDAGMLAANRAGLRPIVTIISNPPWAATYANGPIDKVGLHEFAEFMAAVAERYDGDGDRDAPGSPRVDHWEFYNEPDGGDALRAEYGAGYWGHFGDRYAAMLCAAYPVVKASNTRAQVIMGGLAYDAFETADPPGPFARNFIDDVLKAGGANCFDVMNFHYYPAFVSAWEPFGHGLTGKAAFIRIHMGRYGAGDKPMICTEAGWHSDNYSVYPSTPEIQAGYVVKLFAQSFAAGLDTTIWWTWIDPGSYYGANGLLTWALQPKLSYAAYQAMTGRLRGATLQRVLSADELGAPALEGYLFSAAAPTYVLWSNDAGAYAVYLNASRVRLWDMLGNAAGQVADADDGLADGRLKVRVEPAPLYVEVLP